MSSRRLPLARRLAPVLAAAVSIAFAAAVASGCGAVVGDACDSDTDCGSGLFCERTFPGGYCTISDCDERRCPEEGVCVQFDEATSYCMFACGGGDDCRDDYQCLEGFGPHPFCHFVGPP